MAADLTQQITDAAAAPKTMTVDGTTATQHDLAQQIEADRYLAAKNATRKKGLGIVLGRFKPPGSV